MNKKQLLTLWIVGLIGCSIFLTCDTNLSVDQFWGKEHAKINFPDKRKQEIKAILLKRLPPVIILGTILIYSLRDRRKY